jgi:hypothetical protein
MSILVWASLLLLPWQLTPSDPVVSMLRQVVAEVEARYDHNVTLQLDSQAWSSEKQAADEQLRQLQAAGRVIGRSLVDVRKALVCVEERSSYGDCTLPKGMWVLQVTSLSVSGERAEMWFRLLFNSEGGGVRSPGFEASFERGASGEHAWKLQRIRLRIMP